ncbi:MAG TPA: Na-translocating system protein MpsC family protein [Solirubrobacteraceae bacterium]|nr:Na-translocating system protein MpsC family protein [Solirubrobacteraceae bacterium]
MKSGELNAALTSAIVGIHTKHLGRGPSSASTFHNENVITVLMRDVMTQVEKKIALSGGGHAVSSMRQLFQEAMRSEFTEAVERLSGRKVIAFISGNHVDPDIAVELFILDAAPETD